MRAYFPRVPSASRGVGNRRSLFSTCARLAPIRRSVTRETSGSLRNTAYRWIEKRTGQRDVYSLAQTPTGKGGQTQSAPPFYQFSARTSKGRRAVRPNRHSHGDLVGRNCWLRELTGGPF